MINTTKNIPIIGIYKITSPTKKIYIGQSSNIYLRWNKYMREDCADQPRILRSLKKYGPQNHIFEIIEECSLEQLNEREIHWGIFYKVLEEKGLNCRLGNGSGACSEETKLKMSKSRLGQKRTQNTKNKMSKSHLGKQYKLGYKLTQEIKDKISSKSTRILCIETNKIFKNIKYVSEEMNISHTFIWRVCKGIRKNAKGYTFKFINKEV